ncbi:hypothetical protein CY34DRAFT_468129 [Suillus luteus UH-Slu-Lm8-n1]|uniref:Uncharacterized protein n=1 Tax=Suillus luteus UH-Slu-Lm8-n1 TaxID=930992 RepID=A0A0C9ZIM1_9AGAM|nr:hypothetical protein CY34DRAFT_468129 [Suillus luteus UH-Slu-Lm8-n1]
MVETGSYCNFLDRSTNLVWTYNLNENDDDFRWKKKQGGWSRGLHNRRAELCEMVVLRGQKRRLQV